MAELLQCEIISFKGQEHLVLFTSSTAMLLALFHLDIYSRLVHSLCLSVVLFNKSTWVQQNTYTSFLLPVNLSSVS